jgi:hypothetical protein
MQAHEAGDVPNRGKFMKMRLILSAGLLLGLSGCATYDYVGSGAGGYYSGAASVQRTYPYGYPYGGGYGPYGYGSYGYYDYYRSPYPVYRPPYNPPPRPPHGGHWGDGHRPPPGHGNGNGGHRPPPRPGDGDGNGRPPHPRPPVDGGGSGKSPWRDMDRPTRPQPRPQAQAMPRSMPSPQANGAPRPMMQRPAPARPPSQSRPRESARQQEL